MKKQIAKFLPVTMYVENPEFKMERIFLKDQTYAEAISSFSFGCTDVILFNKGRKTVYLATRLAKPMQGFWVIGGRMLAGENAFESIVRCFKRETTLDINPERFNLIAQNRYIWKDREQEPQNTGSDNQVYVFALEPTREELLKINESLDSEEYNTSNGLQEFDFERLLEKNVNEAIIDLYLQLFPVREVKLFKFDLSGHKDDRREIVDVVFPKDFSFPFSLKQVKIISFSDEAVEKKFIVGNHFHTIESNRFEMFVAIGGGKDEDKGVFLFRYRERYRGIGEEKIYQTILKKGDSCLIPPEWSHAFIPLTPTAQLWGFSNFPYDSKHDRFDPLFSYYLNI